MSITKIIENARRHLHAGNPGAYARAMSAAIRSAMSDRSAAAYRKAIIDDQCEHMFVGLATSCPRAKG